MPAVKSPPTPDTPDAPEDAAPKTLIDEYFEDAHKLATEKDELHKRIASNREALRLFARTGKISEDGMKELNKLYPPREKKDKTDTPAAS